MTNKIIMRTSVIIVAALTLFACGTNVNTEKAKDELAKEERSRTNTTDTTIVTTPAQVSTAGVKEKIRIVSYNVLKYGDECQGPNSQLHQYLATIVKYTSPDILGLVKVADFKLTPDDKNSNGIYGFQDSILKQALDKAFPNRYAAAPTTDIAAGNNMNVLFYDKEKFGFSSLKNLCSNETDFDLYKLYNRQLTSKGDTTYLYFILNHTQSGNKSDDRDQQAQCILEALKKNFKILPNVVDMGDFNLHTTEEPGYHALVSVPDENMRFFDPPFIPDQRVKYPADWDNNPEPYTQFLTTSTRKKDDNPNTCGTGGGAKSWFDHILLSKSLINPGNSIHYVRNSYHTVGNDGKRLGISVNQKKEPNTAVPAEVADALFNFSNKYPVTLDLEVTSNKKGTK